MMCRSGLDLRITLTLSLYGVASDHHTYIYNCADATFNGGVSRGTESLIASGSGITALPMHS
jgi:hypothetical protein